MFNLFDGFDELFLMSHSSDKPDSGNKINWKFYALGLLFSVITTGLVVVGIFFSAVFDSVVSVLVLGVLAVISAMDYKK